MNLELLRVSRREKDLGLPGSPETLGHRSPVPSGPCAVDSARSHFPFLRSHQASVSLPLPHLLTASVASAESQDWAPKVQAEDSPLSFVSLPWGPRQCPLTWGSLPSASAIRISLFAF